MCSDFALASLTKNTAYSDYDCGDFRFARSGLLATIAKWDIESKEDCYKAHFVFVVKKFFHFLDRMGVGRYAFGSEGFEDRLSRCITYQRGLKRNALVREQIIDALGGREDCAKIRTHDYGPIVVFHSGEWVVQIEDMIGCKGLFMRLCDRQEQIYIANAIQRHRETYVNPPYDGSAWILTFDDIDLIIKSTDDVAKFIKDVREGRHERFSIAPKP